jgi:hypothetical protein
VIMVIIPWSYSKATGPWEASPESRHYLP